MHIQSIIELLGQLNHVASPVTINSIAHPHASGNLNFAGGFYRLAPVFFSKCSHVFTKMSLAEKLGAL